MVTLSDEKLAKEDHILVEIGKHSGTFIIGMVAHVQEQETGDIVYYYKQYWHHVREEFDYMPSMECIDISQCRKIAFNGSQG